MKATRVPFAERRKLDCLKPPTFHDETVQFSYNAKFLILVLYSELTWNQDIEQMTNV